MVALVTAERTRPLPFDEAWLTAPSVPAEPGVYEGVPFDVYERIPALTRRVLEWIDADNGGSPMHAWAAYQGELKHQDRDTWRFGRAEHTLILEGEDELRNRWMIAPSKCQKIKGDGTKCDNGPKLTDGKGGWWCGVKGHAKEGAYLATDYINERDLDRIRAMHASIQGHPFNRHLGRKGWRELVLVYDVDVEFTLRDVTGQRQSLVTGIRCRCRTDRVAPPALGYPWTIVDLKRMPRGGGGRWNREQAIISAELHVQAASYVEGVRATFGLPRDERVDFYWLFVEEAYPHDVVPFPASPDLIRAGQQILDQRRALWALCHHLGQWPGRVGARQLVEVHRWGHDEPPPCEPSEDPEIQNGPIARELKRLGVAQTYQTQNGSEVYES